MLIEHVEAAERAENLQRHRVDVVLHRDVADDAVGAGMLAGDPFDALALPRDERDMGALRVQPATSARPRPDVPPVIGDARSGVKGLLDICKESPLLSRSLLPAG